MSEDESLWYSAEKIETLLTQHLPEFEIHTAVSSLEQLRLTLQELDTDGNHIIPLNVNVHTLDFEDMNHWVGLKITEGRVTFIDPMGKDIPEYLVDELNEFGLNELESLGIALQEAEFNGIYYTGNTDDCGPFLIFLCMLSERQEKNGFIENGIENLGLILRKLFDSSSKSEEILSEVLSQNSFLHRRKEYKEFPDIVRLDFFQNIADNMIILYQDQFSIEKLKKKWEEMKPILVKNWRGMLTVNPYETVKERVAYCKFRFPETAYIVYTCLKATKKYLKSGKHEVHLGKFYNKTIDYSSILEEHIFVSDNIMVLSLGGACGPEALGIAQALQKKHLNLISVDRNDWSHLLLRLEEVCEEFVISAEIIQLDMCNPNEVLIDLENRVKVQEPIIITSSFFVSEQSKKNDNNLPRFGKTYGTILSAAPVGSLFFISDKMRDGVAACRDLAISCGFVVIYTYEFSTGRVGKKIPKWSPSPKKDRTEKFTDFDYPDIEDDNVVNQPLLVYVLYKEYDQIWKCDKGVNDE